MKRISTKIFAATVNVFDNTSCTPKRNLKSEGYPSLFGDVLGMNATKILGLVSIIGALLGAIGCFLPWGQETSIYQPNVFLYAMQPIPGLVLTLGKLSFFGCIVAFFSQLVFILRNKNYAILVTLIGGFVAFSCSDAWLLEPGIYETGLVDLEVLYGVYVTLCGAGIVLAGAILSLYVLAEKAASLTVKSKIGDQDQARQVNGTKSIRWSSTVTQIQRRFEESIKQKWFMQLTKSV